MIVIPVVMYHVNERPLYVISVYLHASCHTSQTYLHMPDSRIEFHAMHPYSVISFHMAPQMQRT